MLLTVRSVTIEQVDGEYIIRLFDGIVRKYIRYTTNYHQIGSIVSNWLNNAIVNGVE